MIKNSFIKKQIEKSKKDRQTSYFLRKLIFSVLEAALKERYGDDYSMKCLQSSVMISKVLNDLGISSKVFCGAVCVSQVFEDSRRPPSWNGFWGEDHHVWASSEFGEIIDLTIGALHLHPLSKKHAQLPMPPLWWSDLGYMPKIIRYLPAGVAKIQLPEFDAKDLVELGDRVSEIWENTLGSKQVEDVEYGPILHGIEAMNQLHEAGLPWLTGSYILQEVDMPHPQWVIERESELIRNWQGKNK